MRIHRNGRRAATAVEASIIYPITFFLLLGLIVGGMGMFRYQQMASLARETARYASVHGTDYAKATADKFTEAGTKAFKDSVEKSLVTIADLNNQSKANLEAVVASVTAATKGAESLGAQAMAFAKKTAEDNTAAARSLTSAKSLQEAVELQTAFAKSSLEAYVSEMTRWTETVSASVKDTLRPINERVTAVVDQFQAAR